MYFVMFIFGTLWTIVEYASNTRWIEIGSVDVFSQAPPLIEFLALTYDVVIEIAAVYIPFLALPYLFKKIGERDGAINNQPAKIPAAKTETT